MGSENNSGKRVKKMAGRRNEKLRAHLREMHMYAVIRRRLLISRLPTN